jgi:spermidine/putrescine transport system permease protein
MTTEQEASRVLESDSGAAAGGRRSGAPWVLCAPALIWIGVFSLAPLLLILGVSGLSRGAYGDVGLPWTLENYKRLAGWSELGFDPLYPKVVARTVVVAAGVTLLTLVLSLPLAFFIAGLSRRARNWVLLLVVIPFWTNLLIRTYAWQVLLSAGSPLARLAAWAGWIPPDVGLYPGWFAVALVMTCDFLPFMALPLYASVEKVDWTLAEAAADLGASRWQVFRHGIWPQILPGARAGGALVFLPALGQFVIPELLGGGRTTLLGNLIQQQFGSSRDWPLGAAASTALLLALLGTLVWLRRRAPAGREEWLA